MTDHTLSPLQEALLATAVGAYCTGEESLRITSLSGDADAVVAVTGRFFEVGRPAPTPLDFRHVPATDRSATSSDFPLGHGWLLGLTAIAVTGSPVFAHTFVRVDLVRGTGTQATVLQTLLQGPVSALHRRAWPGSPIQASIEGAGAVRSIVGTDPAANVEISETVPAGARWRLLSWRATLVTDGNVANRVVDLLIDDGTTVLFGRSAAIAQAASLNYVYQATPGADVASNTNNTIAIPFSAALVLPAGYRIRTSTNNRQATDNWGAPQMLVEEWIEAQ